MKYFSILISVVLILYCMHFVSAQNGYIASLEKASIAANTPDPGSIDHNKILEKSEKENEQNVLMDSDGDGVEDSRDLDDDNDGILDINEGCLGEDVDMKVDGTFESLANIASSNSFNGNVKSGGWFNGKGSADSWLSPMPTTGSGVWGGLADGTPSSPNGGVFVAAWAKSESRNESFYINLTDLTVGKDYILKFYQTHAGIDGATKLGSNARWKVKFGKETKFSSEMPYLGEGKQVWMEETLQFTAGKDAVKLEFISDPGTDGISGKAYDCPGIDGIRLYEASAQTAICSGQDTDGDRIPDHLDTDADGDGCPDVLEGSGGFSENDLDGNNRLAGGVDANGVPLAAGSNGQSAGESQNAAIQLPNCQTMQNKVADSVAVIDDLGGEEYARYQTTYAIDISNRQISGMEGRVVFQDGIARGSMREIGGVASNFNTEVIRFESKSEDVLTVDRKLSASYTKEAWIFLEVGKGPCNNIISGSTKSMHAFWVPKVNDYRLAAGHNTCWGQVEAAEPLSTGWHHVAVTYDVASETMKLYQDGNLVDVARDIKPFKGDGFVQVGAYDTGNYFFGEMQEVQIWDYARSIEEIIESMNSSSPSQTIVPGN